MGGHKILLLRVNRHPKDFENALVQHQQLTAVRNKLVKKDSAFSRKIGTDKVFVFPDEYSSALTASQGQRLTRHHVIVSEMLAPVVNDVIGMLPHKANVRVMEQQPIAFRVPDKSGEGSKLFITRFGYLDEPPQCKDDARTAVSAPGALKP